MNPCAVELPVATADLLLIFAPSKTKWGTRVRVRKGKVQGGARARQITNGGVHSWPKAAPPAPFRAFGPGPQGHRVGNFE